MTTKLMASVAFGGGLGDPDFTNDIERDFDLDPDIAAAELRQAGYEVYLLPDSIIPAWRIRSTILLRPLS